MVKRKIFAVMTAAAMMTTMFGTTVFGASLDNTTTTTTIEGSSYSVEPIIAVELPGDLAFGINPLSVDADGDTATTADKVQVVSSDYTVINYSQVPVAVQTSVTADKATGSKVNFVTAPATSNYDTVSKDLKSADDQKDIVLAMAFPAATSGVTVNAEGTEATLTTLTYTAKAIDTDLKKGAKILGGTAQTSIFQLTAFDYSTEKLVATNVSGFRLIGAVDPTQTFDEGEVTVKATFAVRALTANEADSSSGIFEADNTDSLSVDASVVKFKSGVNTYFPTVSAGN
jgi:hypothetical protein